MRVLKTFPVLAATTAAFVAATPAFGGTDGRQEEQALSKPRIYSHGQQAQQVCLISAQTRGESSGSVFDGFGCQKPYSPLPVHRGGTVFVKTPRAAQALELSNGGRTRACTETEPGRWRCLMPAPVARLARVDIHYPRADSHWEFPVKKHAH